MSYVFVFHLKKDVEVKVGALGTINFVRGYYMYVGSAKVGISRVCRHFKKEKKLRWHIDYLTTSKFSEPICAYLFREEECKLARRLKLNYEFVPNFGCSDCSCRSHLFYSHTKPELFELKPFQVLYPEDCLKNSLKN